METSLEKRTWFRSPDDSVRLSLVQGPLTFGHSQLEMTFSSDTEEHEKFLEAASHIYNALVSLKKTLTPQIISQFKYYAFDTFTAGTYIRTLILRSTIEEESFRYKIHLVPFFTSHADKCKK